MNHKLLSAAKGLDNGVVARTYHNKVLDLLRKRVGVAHQVQVQLATEYLFALAAHFAGHQRVLDTLEINGHRSQGGVDNLLDSRVHQRAESLERYVGTNLLTSVVI